MPLVQEPFGDIITFTRASTATFFNSSGVLTSAAINAPRFDYNPATLAARGFLIEEARTNSIRNNTMQGASAGVAPTNWTGWNITTNGVTIASSAAGTENGIAYIDVAVSGTCTLTGTAQTPSFEAATQIAATVGQTWTESVYWTLVSGLLGNSSFSIRMTETDSGGLSLTSGDSTAIIPTVGNLRSARYTFTRTTTNASTAFIVPRLRFGFVNGSTYNFTLRIGLPQLELGAFATSVILTTNAAPLGVTRSADVASVNTLSPWYNQTEGTVYAELQSLSPLTAAQSVALNKYPHLWQIEAGAFDSNPFWYGIGVELYIGGAYNGIGVVPSGINKFAVSLAASGGQSRSSLNGAAAVNRNGTLTGTATGFFLGCNSTAGANNFLNGWLRRITVYPRALSAAELPAITA